MTRFDEVNDYLSNTVCVGYGLGIGGNQQITDIVFEGVTDVQAQVIKNELVRIFPDVVNFK